MKLIATIKSNGETIHLDKPIGCHIDSNIDRDDLIETAGLCFAHAVDEIRKLGFHMADLEHNFIVELKVQP